MSQISVIIVSWNARGYLRDCLNSIRQTGGALVREVIVVDNASSDGSPEMVTEQFPEVTLVKSQTNLGFARANNLGIRQASGSLLALINSDVLVHPECFQRLEKVFESNAEVGMVGPKVFGRDGNLQPSCRRLPTLWNTLCEFLLLNKLSSRCSLFNGFQMRPDEHQQQAEVKVLSGCFWLVRRTAVEQVGGLDEDFFFYAEDIDWCKRFNAKGWKLRFVPEATAIHFGGGSSANAPLRYYIEILRANLLYWKKHHGKLGRDAYYLLTLLHHSVRLSVRMCLKICGLAKGDVDRHIQEHVVCLRWLLTGREC